MDASFSNIAWAFINPYGREAMQFRAQQLQLRCGGSSQEPTNQASVAAKMGIQSQLRDGSVKKCKKRSTKLLTKYKVGRHDLRQAAIVAGGVAFNSIEHCKICKAEHLKMKVKHLAHDERCSRKRVRKGHEMTVFVNKEAARNLAANRAAMKNKTAETSRQNVRFFQPRTNRVTTAAQPSIAAAGAAGAVTAAGAATAAAAASDTGAAAAAASTASAGTEKRCSKLYHPLPSLRDMGAATAALSIADPTSLRRELDERMKKLESEGNDYCWLEQAKYPAAIGLMADYICSSIEHRKPTCTNTPTPDTVTKQEAAEKYRAFFPKGSFEFTFGVDMCDDEPNPDPSPHYHALEGQTILHVDWKLAFPKVDLLCYNCKHCRNENVHLVHDRTNFSKRKKLFPIWSHSGLPTWCVVMNYKCEKCSATYAANDGRLLSVLPTPVAAAYPVLPRYAAGQFHLHKDQSDQVEQLLKTYANGKFISNSLHRKLGVVYTRKAETYLAQSPTRGFISYEAFTGGITPPTPSVIRAAFKDAEHSTLTPYGYSQFDRYEREGQSVVLYKNEKCAFDWTFGTLKNYNLPGAKAVFTGNKGSTKEIITLAIVPTTAANQISHLLLQSREKRTMFEPTVLYTDTCPHNDEFWKGIFGTYLLQTKLGLFHLLHRVVETLDTKCDLYWKCLVKLRNAIYTYFVEDEAALLKALKDGSFSKVGDKLTDKEIRELRHSKKWNQRYSEFLRKLILPGATQRHGLYLWIVEFKDECDQSGRSVFSRNTEKVATEQLKKVHHSSDVPGMNMYQEILPGKRSTHGLSKWRCDRPESPLENFHEYLAHFGNTGMHPILADTLTLGGTMEFNVKMRWKYNMNNKKLAGETVDIPGDFADLPRYFDHSYLNHLNELAQKKGLPPMFEDVHLVGENNGEVFLSKYFEEQMVRNQTVGQDTKTSMCQCPSCIAYMLKNTPTRSLAPENDNNDNDNSNDMDMPADLPPVVLPVAPPLFVPPSSTASFVPPLFVPPLFIPPSSTASFVPPIPLAQLAYGYWMPPRPHDCCYMVGDAAHCSSYAAYLRQKNSGVRVLGKPPHDKTCPVRRQLQR
jgi:hypothetical protein